MAKMGWLVCFLLTSSITLIFGQEHSEALQALFEEAALDVLVQHSEEMSQWVQPPTFNAPPDLMRSYVPGTGVGNREELVIQSIKEMPVFHDTNFTRWHYKRFNNTDFILGSKSRNVVLKKMEFAYDDFFAFSVDDAVFNFVADPWSVVTDVTIFTRIVKGSAVLYVAILAEGARSSVVHIYEIVGERGSPVGVIELEISPASNLSAKKLSFVHSQYGEMLVVLIDSPDVAQVIYQQKGSFELNHYIEVYYPSAVAIKTFTILGHGYIAVANASQCDIFKLDEFAQSHIPFDRLYIPRGDLVDLEYFRLGFHHYLVISGRNEQSLYAHKSGEFALKQRLNTYGVVQIFSAIIPTCRDEVILLSIQDGTTEMFVYNGKIDKFMPSAAVIPPTFRILPGSVTTFTHKNKAVLLFLNPEGILSAFTITTSLQPVQSPVIVAGEEVSKYMKDIQNMLQEQTRQVQSIKDILRNAVRTFGDQHISAFQSFEKLHSTEGTLVNEIKQPIFIEWQDSSLTLEEYKAGTEMLEKNVENLEKLVEEIERIIPDVVRTDEPNEITGTKKFTGDISGSSVLTLSVNLQNVAGINVPELQKDVYRLDKPQQVKGTLTFEKPLTITGNLDVEETINGIDISNDVMTTNTKQTSDALMFFKNALVVQGDLHISGKLNDIDIGKEVVTLGGSHTITGRKSFLNGIIADSVETKLLDGIDIDDLYERALTKSGDQDVPGTKVFNGGLVTNDIILHGYFNGYNITELAENIVRVDRPAYITGHKTFLDDVTLQAALTVDGKVNGIRIPEDLFLTDESQTVPGYKEFTGTVTGHNVIVTGTVDDLVIPDDIVTLSGDEEVESTLHFTEGINVENDIIVAEFVDGVDVSEVAREALKLNETLQFKHGIFFGPVTITDNLSVGGMVNKVNLTDIVNDIIFKHEKDIVVDSQKNFKKVVADSVTLGRMINGCNIDVDFMKVHGDQIITGTKIFEEPVVFNNIQIEDGMVGNLDINELYKNRNILLIEDEVEEDIEFTDQVIVEGDLVVHGKVGGLKLPEDAVLKNSTESIANKVFTNLVKVDNLVVGGNADISGKFGGVNLTQFYHDRISLHGDQDIEGDVWLGSSTAKNIELSGLVNGINITEFASNIMSKTKNQDVLAVKDFTGQTTAYGPITTEEGVNGINLTSLNDRAFKLDHNNYVTVPLEFEDITVKNISVVGFVNGVNLSRMAEDSLKKKGLQHVTGINVFEAGFHVEGDIAANTVNDLVIPESILLKNLPQTISGQYTLKNLHVSGDVHIEGLVNGLDLSEIAPRLARTDQDTIIESNVTFVGPVHIFQDVDVSGLVNGMDMKRLADNILLKEGDQTITGNKVLRGSVTIRGDIDVDHVNGIDWKAFLADIVRTHKPQIIRSPKTFSTDVEVNNLNTEMARIGLLNGRRLEDLVNDAVFTDIPVVITGSKVFRLAVEVTGDMDAELINGLQLKTDVITLMCSKDSPQIITGQKTFENITAYADIHVGGTVNSYNLYDLYKDTLLTEGNQTILGKKTLIEEVTFLGDVFPDTVNGINLHEDLVTLNTDQEISGPLEFHGNVHLKKDLDVQGLLNGVNVSKLAEEAVYLDTDDTIEGSYHLETAIVASDVAVDGLVNDIDLAVFDRNVSDFWNDASQSLIAMDKHSEDSCELVNYLQDVLSKSFYVLDSFIIHQDLGFPATYVHSTSSEEIALVCMTNDPSSATVVKESWSSTEKVFVPRRERVGTAIAKTLVHKIGYFDLNIYIGIDEKSSFVQLNGSVLHESAMDFKEADILVKGQSEAIIALLYPSRGVCELLRVIGLLTLKPEIQNYGSVNVGKGSTSIAIFEIGNVTLIAVSSFSTPPYVRGFFKIYERVNGDWGRIQSISVAASTYVKHFLYHDYHYLAFTNVAPVHESKEPKSIQVYRNSGPNPQSFSLFQKIPFDDSKGMELFEFGDLSELHLTTWNETRIQVFRLEGESGFRVSVTLHGKCVQDVKPLLINDDIYLAVGQHNQKNDQLVTSVLYKGLTKGAKYSPHNFTHC